MTYIIPLLCLELNNARPIGLPVKGEEGGASSAALMRPGTQV